MRNGYFRLEECLGGTGIRFFAPDGDGEKVRLNEVMDYLTSRGISYDITVLNRAIESGEREVVPLVSTAMTVPERESYLLTVSEDCLRATVRFYAPSPENIRIEYEEFMRDLQFRYITYGVKEDVIRDFFSKEQREYCTDILVAEGIAPRQGRDADIEYFFDTNLSRKPALKEDGSVDFFHLNTLCQCEEGQTLAQIIPADEGEYGYNVKGEKLKPREVKKCSLKFGRNIQLSEDRMSIISMVAGHVTLVEDKVFVSNVLEVENVDNSTGNIEFEGSVEIHGNVCTNFEVRAKGNIIVRGVVEGAVLAAGGDIIIERGVNGMSRGVLAARGNVVSKFLENVNVSAGGYITTDSILHSKIYAGTEVNVSGKKGFITGGHVCATNLIAVKTLGSPMGASTIVEVGAQPDIKKRLLETQKQIGEIQKTLKSIQPIVTVYNKKKQAGLPIEADKKQYFESLIIAEEQKRKEMEKLSEELEHLQALVENKNNAQIAVEGEVYPGTKIVISEVSMMVQKKTHYCRFIKRNGDVKMVAFI